uniref:Superoxide dismutase n=1 Tax=Salarias fasciatus TaxID=181472 RepID=A0A672IIM8_SALFA
MKAPIITMNILFRVGQTLMRSATQAVRPVAASRQKYSLPDLPYDYGALEPHISAETMRLHHSQYHAKYVENLNRLENLYVEALEKGDGVVPRAIEQDLIFNSGGHINHSIFWKNLSPNGGGEPKGALMDAIRRDFGSFENLKEKMSVASMSIRGAGWTWLGYNKWNRTLENVTCANQDLLHRATGLTPLLGIDVWEHAYCFQHKTNRSSYIKSIWNVVNWDDVSQRFNTAESSNTTCT